MQIGSIKRGKEGGAVSELRIKGKAFFLDESGSSRILDQVFEDIRKDIGDPSGFNYMCSEIGCINQALKKNFTLEELEGAEIRTLNIGGGKYNQKHKSIKDACKTCTPVLDKLWIKNVNKRGGFSFGRSK